MQMEKEVKKLKYLIEDALFNLKSKKTILLFSGGLDSAVLVRMMQLKKINFSAITSGTKNSSDIKFSKQAAKEMRFPLKVVLLNEKLAKECAIKAVNTLKDANPVFVSIAIPEIAMLEQTKSKEPKIIITGLGSDEIFAGYNSHQKALEKGAIAVQNECKRRILQVKKDVKRDKTIAQHYKHKVYFPFLDKNIVNFGLKLPAPMKISKNERKIILRRLAKEIGLPEFISNRPKKAMQYGSGSNDLLKKISRKEGFKSTSEFLKYYIPNNYLKNKKVKK